MTARLAPGVPLPRWGAVRLADAMARRELSVAALATALVEHSVSLEPALRAWAWFDAEAALREARRLDRQGPSGPLFGLPLAVKDIIDTAAMPTSYGSPIYAGHVPQADAACVSLAKAAGAWVLGKSATTEFANMTPAATRHPHSADRTPGGSSSGSAAAVAAGLVPLALGTQTAGSVIRPAAFCGVVGYKPSARRIPRAGVKPNSDTLDEVGVFARSVGDAAWLAAVLAGDDALAQPGTRAFAPRIGVTLTTRVGAASADMQAALAGAASRLSAAGAVVQELALPAAFDALFEAQRVVQAFETARALAPERQYRGAMLSPALRQLLEEGGRVDGAAYGRALRTAAQGRTALEGWLDGADVVLAPAAPGAAPSIESTGDPLFSRPWQLLGCPCIALPGGRDASGLPLGLQLVGRPGDDGRLFAAAAWAEARFSA